MRGSWTCSSRVGFTLLAVLGPAAGYADDNVFQIHRLEKDHDLLRHPKREASCQQPGYTLCPASQNGGCCPGNYACAVSYCYATTAGPTSACGKQDWYNCPFTAGPGTCCPVGFICADDCVPPSGISYSQSCPASYFNCPSNLGGGCCPDGLSCGSQTCYPTTPKTFPVSISVTTTNSNGDTITTMITTSSVISPGPDPSATSLAGAAGVPKFIPSTVSKLPSIETGSSNGGGGSGGGGGLTQAQIGGIVGGAVALLVVIVVIAALVIWRLKQTEKAARAAAESGRKTSSGEPRSQKSGYGQLSVSEVDGTDVDSVVRARYAHYRARSDSSTAGERSRSDTPNFYGSNGSTTPPTWPGYSAVHPLASDASDGRQSSLDSYAAQYDYHNNNSNNNNNAAIYAPRASVESEGARTHVRQYSNTSELDGSVVGAHGVSELDAPDGAEATRRRSNSSTRPPPKIHVRRTSDPSGNSRGGRSDGGAVIVAPLGTLDEISELHGHYGPSDLAVGQTAARLHRKGSSVSSAPGYDA